MDQQKAMDILSGRRRGAGASVLRAALSAAAVPYSGAMRIRRWAYRKGLLRSHQADAAVICVGNLTTGGTGKTPMVAWVVDRLKEARRFPAVLTRGYGAVEGRSDEAELLRKLCDVEVIVDADRVAGARAAVAGGADVCVMDDGFQHRRLRRDLDIVLVDAELPCGYGRCLPRGLLREPATALRDAGAVVITRSDRVGSERLAELREMLAPLAPGAAMATAAHKPTAVIDEDARAQPLEALAGRKVFAFCGIARPGQFFDTLAGLHARPVGRLALADHVAYTPAVCERIAAAARRAEAPLLVTTQKDRVKLEGAALPGTLWTLAMEMDVLDGRAELIETLERAAGFGRGRP